MVLTVCATHVAAAGCDGVRAAPGLEMVKGFFFYGIDIFGNNASIDMGIEFAIPVFPDLANTPSRGIDNTPVSTKMAADSILLQFFKEDGLTNHLSGALLHTCGDEAMSAFGASDTYFLLGHQGCEGKAADSTAFRTGYFYSCVSVHGHRLIQ